VRGAASNGRPYRDASISKRTMKADPIAIKPTWTTALIHSSTKHIADPTFASPYYGAGGRAASPRPAARVSRRLLLLLLQFSGCSSGAHRADHIDSSTLCLIVLGPTR
jgi:hypothetical protein